MRDPGGAVLTADQSLLDGVRGQFEELATAFGNAGGPLGAAHDTAITSAGQFAADLRPGAAAFLISWRQMFDACDTDARLIAGNIQATAVNIKAVDMQLAGQVQL